MLLNEGFIYREESERDDVGERREGKLVGEFGY